MPSGWFEHNSGVIWALSTTLPRDRARPWRSFSAVCVFSLCWIKGPLLYQNLIFGIHLNTFACTLSLFCFKDISSLFFSIRESLPEKELFFLPCLLHIIITLSCHLFAPGQRYDPRLSVCTHRCVHSWAQLLWVLFNLKYDVQEARLEHVCTCPEIRAGGQGRHLLGSKVRACNQESLGRAWNWRRHLQQA